MRGPHTESKDDPHLTRNIWSEKTPWPPRHVVSNRLPLANGLREYRDYGAHEEVIVAGALIRMDDRRLRKWIMAGALEMPGRRGRGGKEKEWTDCLADDLRMFGIGGGEGWRTAALEPGRCFDMITEGSQS